VIAMLLGGFQTPGQVGAVNSGTTGSGTSGGGGGLPFVGGFVHSLGTTGSGTGGGTGGSARPAPFGGVPRGEFGTTGTTSSGGGGDWDPTFYFDEYLGLWVENTWSDGGSTTLLFIDQAKEQPAGSFHSTYSDWNTYPVIGTSSYEITAGPFAGAHGSYQTSYDSDSAGSMEYDNFWPGYGSDEGRSAWTADNWTWNSSQSLEDGSWSKSSGTALPDGAGQFVWENSEGYRWAYSTHPDGSGQGTVSGPDPGLPAKVTWTATGHYRIVYADGTVEEWDMFSGVDEVVSGTSGSTGSTGGTNG
jgi:hypothetical protein